MIVLVICSGGLDSVTLAYKIKNERTLHSLVSFDYGQRHKKELQFAAEISNELRVKHQVIDISGIARLLSGSALTDSVEVPDGHYAEENMRVTVVPNRNAIMLSIAFGVAAATGAEAVAAAFHSGDHYIYPDCRQTFVDAFRSMQAYAFEEIWDLDFLAPFVDLTKSEIVRLGADLAVPFEKTWSCYKGLQYHCGRCGTCVERQEAFHLAGVADPTTYEDSDYWIDVCKQAGEL